MAEETLVSYREYVAGMDILSKRQGALELEQARQSAALMHLPGDMRDLVKAVNALASKVATPVATADHGALAIHRAVEGMTAVLERLTNPKPTGASPIIMSFAILGAVALGAFGMKFFGH
jgi:hypothetical protein